MPINTESTHVREQEALAQCFDALNGVSCESLPITSQSRFFAKKKAIMDCLRYMAFLLADEGSDDVAAANAKEFFKSVYGIEISGLTQSNCSTASEK